MKIIILAGGGGTRLFPLSRTCFPKQFLKVYGERSLLAQTITRFRRVVNAKDIIVVTGELYRHQVNSELQSCGMQEAHVLLEPAGRNTAPAIALAARYCLDELGCSPDEIMFISTADHLISPVGLFEKRVWQAVETAEQDKIVTFGITPDKPETGYGYIQAGEPNSIGAGYQVVKFTEKPDSVTAEQYLAEGNYYWNSGMFAFSIRHLLQELEQHQPEIFELTGLPLAEMIDRFAAMPSISFDYAVAEKSAAVVTIPLECYWNDIGSWDSLYEVMIKDEHGNAATGDCVIVDCSNSLIMGKSRLIAGIGLEDTLVVETDDVIVVAKRGESQKVKDLVQQLKAQGRKEVDEPTTMYRPWGSYTILGEGPGYKMKRIVVNPGQQLSLQLHYHRSEHWIVIGGTALVTIGEDQHMIHKNQSIFVPQTTKHRLENPGKLPLEIIEIQNGEYLGEDDIIRFEDNYGRV